jgi:YihY family inner membrane protein
VNPLERAVQAVDEWQQRHTVPAFLFAVVKKFGDDNGGVLAANLAFVAFGALFPLLLLLTTILGLVLAGDAHLRAEVLRSALAQFPVIGNQLGQNIHSLKARSTPALIISIVGLVWTSIGLSQAALFTMSQVWNLPGRERPDYVHRLIRSFAFLGVMAIGLAVTTGLASFGSTGGHLVYAIGALLAAAAVNILQYLLAFRVLTAASVTTRKLWPGAMVGGVAWTLLQLLGGYLVGHQLHGASEVYGTFAMVIGLIAWVFLGVRVTVYAAEINTVIDRRLWPRSILQPPLTPADRESLRLQAIEEERRPEQRVVVSFEGDEAARAR